MWDLLSSGLLVLFRMGEERCSPSCSRLHPPVGRLDSWGTWPGALGHALAHCAWLSGAPLPGVWGRSGSWGPGTSCTKSCVDFLLKHALQRTKISGCINVCARMNPSTFLLYIPINVEWSAHVGVPDSSLSTPLLKYANHI